ncbi:hypothetical protein BT96DRAFT_992717 [Gymnopus androsaceus JB14]|uniref:Uncharacterized protein n=1 Tax=Gymnopus androsaceus JB14 TaxID=1447944 RepID=A0A6A4HW19_9AGAR|nr:hypothetical protein BT96DRAFT_992717 [Gymnopus androsaceus JB14]
MLWPPYALVNLVLRFSRLQSILIRIHCDICRRNHDIQRQRKKYLENSPEIPRGSCGILPRTPRNDYPSTNIRKVSRQFVQRDRTWYARVAEIKEQLKGNAELAAAFDDIIEALSIVHDNALADRYNLLGDRSLETMCVGCHHRDTKAYPKVLQNHRTNLAPFTVQGCHGKMYRSWIAQISRSQIVPLVSTLTLEVRTKTEDFIRSALIDYIEQRRLSESSVGTGISTLLIVRLNID